jgi:hypothetical protein
MMAASAAILAFGNSEQKCVIKRFCKPCLAARGLHSERAALVEKCTSDLISHLITACEEGLNNSFETATRLASYCIRFNHPQAHEFTRFLMAGACGQLNPNWQEGCQRVGEDLERRGTIAQMMA